MLQSSPRKLDLGVCDQAEACHGNVSSKYFDPVLKNVTTDLWCNGMARTVKNVRCIIRICVIYRWLRIVCITRCAWQCILWLNPNTDLVCLPIMYPWDNQQPNTFQMTSLWKYNHRIPKHLKCHVCYNHDQYFQWTLLDPAHHPTQKHIWLPQLIIPGASIGLKPLKKFWNELLRFFFTRNFQIQFQIFVRLRWGDFGVKPRATGIEGQTCDESVSFRRYSYRCRKLAFYQQINFESIVKWIDKSKTATNKQCMKLVHPHPNENNGLSDLLDAVSQCVEIATRRFSMHACVEYLLVGIWKKFWAVSRRIGSQHRKPSAIFT